MGAPEPEAHVVRPDTFEFFLSRILRGWDDGRGSTGVSRIGDVSVALAEMALDNGGVSAADVSTAVTGTL